MNKRLLQWETWVYGLVSGAIAGGATAATAAGGLAAAHGAGIDVPLLNIKAMSIVFLSSAIYAAMAYLAKSPLPPISTQSTTTTEIIK